MTIFLSRPLEGAWPYLWLDATYVKVRGGGRIISRAVILAVAVAPVAHDSGTLCGKRAIVGGRDALRHGMFQATLVAAHHNAVLKAFADRLLKAGKPHKVVITAVARKVVTIANALCKSRQRWTPMTA